MRKSVLFVGFASVVGGMVGWSVAAQPQANPRQQPGALITMYAPEQHDLYDGHYVLSANRLYEMHFMVTQGIRDRKTLRVNYPMATRKQPGGEVNPATQQVDFYIRSPQQDPKNRPTREVFMHFFAMEVTWK